MHSNLLSDNKGALGRKTVLRSLQINCGLATFQHLQLRHDHKTTTTLSRSNIPEKRISILSITSCLCRSFTQCDPENVFTVETFYSKKGKLSLAVHSGVILGSPLELNRGQSKASLFSYSQSALNKSYPSITNSALILQLNQVKCLPTPF